jgi:arylsulfatase
VRWDNWKIVFMEQRLKGTMGVWAEPFTKLRVPKVFNLRTDPYEFAETTSNTYWDWVIHQPFAIYPVLAATQKFMATFVEFPPAQHPDSFTVEKAEKTMTTMAGKG